MDFVDSSFGEMLDTSPAQRRRYYDWLRSLTPQQRAREVADLCRAGRALARAGIRAQARAGIRAQDGEPPPGEVERQLVERIYGSPVAERFFKSG